MAVYSEPAAIPSISTLESTGDSDKNGDPQNVPSASGTSKKTSRKAPTKKAPKGKKITARQVTSISIPLATIIHIYSRALGLEDWKKNNLGVDQKKFDYHWKKLPSDKREVCCPLPSRLILSDTVGDLQEYRAREKELVRYCHLRYSL